MIPKKRKWNLGAILTPAALLQFSGCDAGSGILDSIFRGFGDAISNLAEAGLLTFLL
jgi:hypothetical protein